MGPRSLFALPRVALGSLTVVLLLLAGVVGLAFYSHSANAHNHSESVTDARLHSWQPPAGLADVATSTNCTDSELTRCLSSSASAHQTAALLATKLGVKPADMTCRVVRATFSVCNLSGSIGLTKIFGIVSDRGALVATAPVVVPAKPAVGSDVTGSLVDLAISGN